VGRVEHLVRVRDPFGRVAGLVEAPHRERGADEAE
jgi:hypothetical protein